MLLVLLVGTPCNPDTVVSCPGCPRLMMESIFLFICIVGRLCEVPETPVWLLVQGREKEALKSLRYLRGWTTVDQVKEEFDQLCVYAKNLDRCVICWNEGPDTKDCPHQDMNPFKRWVLRVRYVMLCKETLRPLSMVLMYFLFYVMCSTAPIRPNLINLCGAFGMPDDGKNIVLMVGVITLVTSVLVVGIIKLVGKRKLAITAMLGAACSFTALGVYARSHLSDSVFTYDVTTFPTETNYVPLVFFYLLTLFTGLGIPWVLLGEVFPFRSRASAQGLAAAGNYVIMFVGSKTFINLEHGTQLWGACIVYATFGFIGTIYLYFFLPETEGKTLEEIESYYNAEFRTFADDPVANYFRGYKKKT
ncbi:sugar transporter domain-containing protein [Phthorimaea operculella]|nr:sugar transporter domain-containing protein [Phthorimaea operculella]